MAKIDKVLSFIHDNCGHDCNKSVNEIYMEKRYGDDGSYYVFLYDDNVNASMDILVNPGKDPVIEYSHMASYNDTFQKLENEFEYS